MVPGQPKNSAAGEALICLRHPGSVSDHEIHGRVMHTPYLIIFLGEKVGNIPGK